MSNHLQGHFSSTAVTTHLIRLGRVLLRKNVVITRLFKCLLRIAVLFQPRYDLFQDYIIYQNNLQFYNV